MNQLAESLIKTDKSQTVKIPSFVCQQTLSTTLSGPQTTAKHRREVKEITQDHADIMVYKSFPNTQ